MRDGQGIFIRVDIDFREYALHLAAGSSSGSVEAVECLLDNELEVESKGQYGVTALLRAAIKGQLAILKALVARGADTRASDKNKAYALNLAACFSGSVKIVEYLVEELGLSSDAKDNHGQTAEEVAGRGKSEHESAENYDKRQEIYKYLVKCRLNGVPEKTCDQGRPIPTTAAFQSLVAKAASPPMQAGGKAKSSNELKKPESKTSVTGNRLSPGITAL